MRLLLLALCLSAVPSHAATLLCGEVPCERADVTAAEWPEARNAGITVSLEPDLLVNVPGAIQHIRKYKGMTELSYAENGERALSLFTVYVDPGQKAGPVGGWNTLHRAQSRDVTAYYFKDPSGKERYVAVVRNERWEQNDPKGRVAYLQLTASGFEQDEFLGILGSVRSTGAESKR